ncbi:MAG: hypothetical protein AAGG38_14965 [Planctomycetota bacterium]
MPQVSDDPRLTRIMAHRLDDPGAALPFTRRLARENRWTVDFAVRVVREYRRFCYLAVAAGHPVTPSDEVDQAWHLHLLYSRDYWEEFCPNVLGVALHHGPTKGGASEGERFDEQYRRTMASYEAWFGEPPPAAIWPPAEVRFGPRMIGVRVLSREVWVLPRPWRGWRGIRASWRRGS